MMRRGLSIEWVTLLYALAYLPYVILTRMLATVADPALGRPLTGLEILPAMMIMGAVFTFGFMALLGWARDVRRVRVGRLAIPFAGAATFWSGICTALVLVSVPLSYTFANVSVPFIQLLMRGDLLLIAPLVDLVARRRVRWWSWAALTLVAVAMAITFRARGGLNLPPIAIATVVLYTIGYFGRLYIMSSVAKNGDPALLRRYFSEEKIIGFPAALLVLAGIAAAGGGGQAAALGWGFMQVWSSPNVLPIAVCGAMVCATGVFSAIILLDPRENSFCVPLERSASILAGVVGSIVLALWFGGKMPSGAEFAGAGLLILALVILSLAPRAAKRKEAAESA